MRELPPESLLRVLHSDRPAEPPFAVYGHPRDQVLSIQKQAYEDGLRDALKVVERYEHLHEYNPEFEQRRDIEAMLTASQEKK